MKDNKESARAASGNIARPLFIALFAALVGFVGTQMFLFDTENREQLSGVISDSIFWLCGKGIRVPAVGCSRASLIKEGGGSGESLAYQFSRLPDLSAAIDKLQWNNGTEADAARLLSVVQSLGYSRNGQTSQNYQARPAIQNLLRPVWNEYPNLVAASACLYCSQHYDVIEGLAETGKADRANLRNLAAGHPRMLTSLQPQVDFPAAKLEELVQLHAELSAAGDAKTAAFIGGFLAKAGDFARLKLWVSVGLNGGRSLEGLDLDTLPEDVVIAAWQRGVRLGYDEVSLSRYLVSKGYRPALRWVVWLQGSELSYLQGWSYQREKGEYQDMIATYTDFPHGDATALSRHYSDNWRTIHWDGEQGAWRSSDDRSG